MKKIFIYRILAILVTATVIFGACTKEKSDVRLAPKLSTSQFLNVKSDSATVVGFVVAEGDGFTERGICYNTATAPTISNSKVIYTGTLKSATYTVKIGGLAYATKYYAKAYATGPAGTIYGEEVTFTTLPVVPAITTAAITLITGKSATGGGNVTVIGGAAVTARGVCFGLNRNPTIADNKTSDAQGPGAFVSALTGLKGNVTYYVRAYATNTAGTGYGPEVSFATPVDLPVVTTTAVTGVTKVAAISGGEVTYDGGGAVTARGLAWSIAANPTTAGTAISGGFGNGIFITNLTGLVKFTTYHVRAYATNSAGTAYGSDIQFTTLADIMTWNIPGDYVAASYPGSAYSDWSPDKSPQIISTVGAADKLEGYVYMANASNNWKFASQLGWGGPNYGDDNKSGKLNPNASNNINSPKGYYKLNADATAMTYTAVATVWGVIGDATPNSWNDETALTYDPTSSTWKSGVRLTAGSFKFRANHDWGFNYGSDKADGNLSFNGANIPVSLAADYAVTLDLSRPNAYTYSINRWGIIGDAIPVTGWNSDQNLTWDPANKVLKITLDLVVGSWKFRANDDWGVNLGGNTNALTQGGGDLAITAAGNYTITLDLSKSVYSCLVKKN
jgi:hypothetical protein